MRLQIAALQEQGNRLKGHNPRPASNESDDGVLRNVARSEVHATQPRSRPDAPDTRALIPRLAVRVSADDPALRTLYLSSTSDRLDGGRAP